jgi:hypothetical protein
VNQLSAVFTCDGDYEYVEIEGFLSGADVASVEDVDVLVEGTGILTGYHPLEDYLFTASEQKAERKDYAYEVVAHLSGDESVVVAEGVTSMQCE